MLNGFKVIGISTRTTNRNAQSAQDLGKLWEQFHSENIFSRIPNKCSDDILSIYTDYKSDYTDEYTTIIGVPVSTLSDIPDGLIGREFKAETFQKFSAEGEMPKAVADKWLDIWQKDKNLNRKYSYDFELYSDKSRKGEDSEVEIFISTK